MTMANLFRTVLREQHDEASRDDVHPLDVSSLPSSNQNDTVAFVPTAVVPNNESNGMQLTGTIMIILASVFSVLLLTALCCLLEKRRNNRTSQAARSAAAARAEPETPEERYRNIEKWLVNKKAHAHDEVCEMVLQSRIHMYPRSSNAKKQITPPVVADDGDINAVNDKSEPNRKRTLSVNTCVTDNDIETGGSSGSSREEECPIW